MHAVLAKCESCGGALRLDEGAQSAECIYCGATSFIRGAGSAAGSVPTLRVDPPPPIDGSGVKVGIGGTILFGAMAIVPLVAAVFEDGADRIAAACFGVVFLGVSGFAAVVTVNTRRWYRDQVWFREHGLPGRATILGIRVANDGAAALTLELQTAGRETRQLEHTTSVPALLIPRIVQGLSLPVIVHPRDEARVEIQWHLV